MINKLRYPVRFGVSGNKVRFSDVDNRPVFKLEAHDEVHARYYASAITRSLNAYYGLLRDCKDAVAIANSAQASLGIEPTQKDRLDEITQNLSRLSVKKARHK